MCPVDFVLVALFLDRSLRSRNLMFRGLRDSSSLAIGSCAIASGACLLALWQKLLALPFHESEKVVIVTGTV